MIIICNNLVQQTSNHATRRSYLQYTFISCSILNILSLFIFKLTFFNISFSLIFWIHPKIYFVLTCGKLQLPIQHIVLVLSKVKLLEMVSENRCNSIKLCIVKFWVMLNTGVCLRSSDSHGLDSAILILYELIKLCCDQVIL